MNKPLEFIIGYCDWQLFTRTYNWQNL